MFLTESFFPTWNNLTFSKFKCFPKNFFCWVYCKSKCLFILCPLEGNIYTYLSHTGSNLWCFCLFLRRKNTQRLFFFPNLHWRPPWEAFVNEHKQTVQRKLSLLKKKSSACCSLRNNAHQMFVLSAVKAAALRFVDVSFIESFGWQAAYIRADLSHPL